MHYPTEAHAIWSPHGTNAKCVYGQWAHLQRYPEEHRPLACLLKQAQQANMNKRKTTNNTFTGTQNPHNFNTFPWWGSPRHNAPLPYKNHKIGAPPNPTFGNGNLLPSCMERWGLSIPKEINPVSNAIYSSLRENRPTLNLQLCFLRGLVVEFCTLKTWLTNIVNQLLK